MACAVYANWGSIPSLLTSPRPPGIYGIDLMPIRTGRLDNLMTPVRRGVVALAWIEDPDDPRYEISREAFAILRKAGDARERQLEVVPLGNPPGTRAAY